MSSDADNKRFLPYLTSRQIAELPQKERSIVVLPIASIEQHGPYLPVYADSIVVREVLNRVLALLPGDFPVYVLPLLAYGKSNEHSAFPGTITLTSETLVRVLKEIGTSVARSGFRRFAILNGHGGNTAENGVLGDATAADPAKGERFLSDAAAQTAELLREIADFHFADPGT